MNLRQSPIPTPDLPAKHAFQATNEQSLAVRIVRTVPNRVPIDLDHITRRGPLDAQNRDVGQGQIETRVRTRDRDVETAHFRTQIHRLGRVGTQALAIVEVQLTLCRAVDAQRDNDGPRRVPGVPGRHGHLLRSQDRPAADVNRDMTQGGVDGGVFILIRHRHGRLVVPVVIHFCTLDEAGKDAVDARGALREDGRDEDRRAQKELAIRVGE